MLAWFAVKQTKEGLNKDQYGQDSEDTSDIVLEGANTINVGDQEPGNQVVVDLAILSKPGYVVIFELANGRAGRVLGTSAFLKADAHTDITITMITQEGKSYIAMLYADNGDGVFNVNADVPLKDDQGANVTMEFMATANTLEL